MLGKAANPMLEKAEQGIQAKIPAAMQDQFQRMITAGCTILYAPQLASQLKQRIASSANPAQDAAQGAARMMSNLFQQSNKTLPLPLIVPGALVMAFEYLDLVAKAGKTQITPQLISATTSAVADAVLPLFSLTPAKVHELITQRQQGAPATPQAPPGILGAAQAGA